MNCPLCKSEGDVLANLPASVTSESKPLNAPSSLVQCRRCSHLYTHADVDWATYYSDAYDATLTDEGLDELVLANGSQPRFRTEFDYTMFRESVMFSDTARVLEFGCGRGRILSRLAKDGVRNVWACDVSEKYRRLAGELIGADHVSIGSIPEGPFDVICTFFVLEHDSDPLASLKALRARLKGTLFAMVPNWKTNLGDLACADHTHHFSPESLRMLFAEAGLEIIEEDTSAPGTLAVVARVAEPVAAFGTAPLARSAVQPFLDTLAQLQALPQRLDPKRRVFFFGAGFYAALTAAFVHHIDGIFDSNPRKQGQERFGRRVASPETISTAHADDTLVVCVNPRSAAPIAEKYGIAFREVYTLTDTSP